MVNEREFFPYSEIRTEVCAISIELNRRRRLAPRFREMRRPPKRVATSDDRLLSLDRQLIDLHWLHCNGWRQIVLCDRLHFRPLLRRKKFKVNLAEMFAEVPASANEKANWLMLPDEVAFQLAAIQTDRIRERFRIANLGDVRKGGVHQIGRAQVIRMLGTSLSSTPQLYAQIPRWSLIWMCSKLVGSNAEVLRRFHAIAEGLEKPLDRRDIIRRLAAAKKHIAEDEDKLMAA